MHSSHEDVRASNARQPHEDHAGRNQMPWFETRFTDIQRVAWAAAEVLAGVKNATSGAIKKGARRKWGSTNETLVFDKGFAPSQKFAGSQEGHCYRQGERGLGYYKDQRPSRAAAPKENEENKRPVDEGQGASSTRTRLKRDARGDRIRGRKRGAKAGVVGCTPTIPPETDINCKRWWVNEGWWALDSTNANSWTSTKDKVLARSKADIIFAQETGIAGKEGVQTAKGQARKLGWNTNISDAHVTNAERKSGGCAQSQPGGESGSARHTASKCNATSATASTTLG